MNKRPKFELLQLYLNENTGLFSKGLLFLPQKHKLRHSERLTATESELLGVEINAAIASQFISNV
ncbi:hypothetical protein FCL54_06905 [Pseudalkalibacillus caeni]|uniref:Uncharacterized protein n=1 Tax=Exobacillus caeni TaxID=2574798 RepID=A0A5R9FFA5_9BACL|nr:hypothetical protein FCL54_06905 [Pseudalkalibacillus caeni]